MPRMSEQQNQHPCLKNLHERYLEFQQGSTVVVIIMELREIPLDRIIACEKCTFDEEYIKNLAGSIERNGLREPIRIARMGRYYRIIDGERRWRAFKTLRKGKIKALIVNLEEEDPF